MATPPSHDPRLAPLVAAAFLAAVLALGEWTHPVTAGQATAGQRTATVPHPRHWIATPAAVAAATTTGRTTERRSNGHGHEDPGPKSPRAGLISLSVAAPTDSSTLGRGAGAAAATRGRPVASAPARWRAPLDGPLRIARPFQLPVNPYAAGHRGVDLIAQVGATVRAAGEGVVSYAGVLAGRGVVAVTHGATRTTYEPLAVVLVSVGRRVTAGTPIGRLAAGHAGCFPDACLHWGLRRADTYVSPLSLLLLDPPRLLPLAGLLPQKAGSTAGAG